MIRKDWNDQIFRTTKEKDDAIVNKILECNKSGQPLLVFTASINKSEHYSNLLSKKKINHTVLNAKNHEKEADIIADAGKKGSVIITTSISGRGVDIKLGGKNSDISIKNEIKSLGGLFVIGTERMESRRVDNQARGRSGRQGDEGKSIFYVSLEDDLMRIFGSESMNSMLEKLGLKDGESIDHPWINKALERAQQKVEARNFDIRKTLLKFDNVLNDQRHVIFEQRNNVINNEISNDYSDVFLKEVTEDIYSYKKNTKLQLLDKEYLNKLKNNFGKGFSDTEYDELMNEEGEKFKNIIKSKFAQKRQDRIKLFGEKNNASLEKRIFLQLVDQNWKTHLQYLEHLRQVIGLRSYGQRDPLIEYKKEAFSLFENLLHKLKTDLVRILINLEIIDQSKDKNSKNEKENIINNPKCLIVLKKGQKISRNDRCEVTGKKYKNCCGSI